MATTKIADAREELNELSLEVDPEAPLVEGLDCRSRAALVKATVHERVALGKSKHDTVDVLRVRLVEPRWLRVRDGATTALLDVGSCELEGSAQTPIDDVLSLHLPAWAEPQLAGKLEPAKNHRAYIVAWSTLQPGDRLLVYGEVKRAHPSEVGAEPSAGEGYRGASTVLTIAGPTFALRGTEAELDAQISRERRTLLPLCVALAFIAALTVAGAWLAATLA